jgi:hypothetical protein
MKIELNFMFLYLLVSVIISFILLTNDMYQ